MSNALILFPMLAAGFLLGLMFFGVLVWTTRKGLASGNPVAWFLCSWIARITIVLVAFYLVSGAVWQRVLVCLAGFILARNVVIRRNNQRRKQYVQ